MSKTPTLTCEPRSSTIGRASAAVLTSCGVARCLLSFAQTGSGACLQERHVATRRDETMAAGKEPRRGESRKRRGACPLAAAGAGAGNPVGGGGQARVVEAAWSSEACREIEGSEEEHVDPLDAGDVRCGLQSPLAFDHGNDEQLGSVLPEIVDGAPAPVRCARDGVMRAAPAVRRIAASGNDCASLIRALDRGDDDALRARVEREFDRPGLPIRNANQDRCRAGGRNGSHLRESRLRAVGRVLLVDHERVEPLQSENLTRCGAAREEPGAPAASPLQQRTLQVISAEHRSSRKRPIACHGGV